MSTSAMRHIVRFGLLIILLVPLIAEPMLAQDRERETRSVDTFTAVSFSVPGTLHLRQGDPATVEVEGEAAVLEELETTVDDGTLEIQAAQEEEGLLSLLFGGDSDIEPVDAYVTVPTLESVSLAGSGTIRGEAPIDGRSLAVRNAGSGAIELDLAVASLEVRLAGSGHIRLRGSSDDIDAQIAGSGDIQAPELTAETAAVEIAGSGTATLSVVETLSAQIMGSGDVAYRGSPEVKKNIVGSGDVRSIE